MKILRTIAAFILIPILILGLYWLLNFGYAKILLFLESRGIFFSILILCLGLAFVEAVIFGLSLVYALVAVTLSGYSKATSVFSAVVGIGSGVFGIITILQWVSPVGDLGWLLIIFWFIPYIFAYLHLMYIFSVAPCSMAWRSSDNIKY